MTGGWDYLRRMHNLRKILATAVLGIAVLALRDVPARAGGTPVVVELYTSQGCNSCPPADVAVSELARRDDVIALSLHVDYWDYLGWRDTFAQHQFGQRQHGYREAWGKRVVYTPQVVVQGARDVRATIGALESAISAAQSQEPPITVSIERSGGMLKCRIDPGPRPVTGTVWIAKYALSETVEIERGENAGRELTYINVVNSLSRIGDWAGSEPEEVAMPQPDPGEGVAIWIQDGAAGPILAAAKIENRVD